MRSPSTIGVINAGMRATDLLRKIVNAAHGDEMSKHLSDARAFIKDLDKFNAEMKKLRQEDDARRAKRAASGRKANSTFEIAPRHEGGCDHGATGIVLMRKGDTRLVWRSGSKYFSGIGSQGYAPAELEILVPSNRMPTKLTDSHAKRLRGESGGKVMRLSSELVIMYVDHIDSVFGKGSAVKAAALKETVIL